METIDNVATVKSAVIAVEPHAGDRWKITVTVGEDSWTDTELREPRCGVVTDRGMLAAALSFLSAALEGRAYSLRTGCGSDNADLFEADLLNALEGAEIDSDDLSIAELDIEEE